MRGHRSSDTSDRRRRRRNGPLGDVLIAPRPGGSVALCLQKGVYLDLDRSATEIVELVQRHGVDGAVTMLAERHGLAREASSGHVDQVLRTFASVGPGPATPARALTPAGSLRGTAPMAQFSDAAQGGHGVRRQPHDGGGGALAPASRRPGRALARPRSSPTTRANSPLSTGTCSPTGNC